MSKTFILNFVIQIWVLTMYGCAYQYVDGDGSHHTIGLAHVVQKKSSEQRKDVLIQQVSVIGASVLILPEHSGVSFGYTRNFSVEILEDNVAGEFLIDKDDATSFKYIEVDSTLKDIKNEY